MINILERLSEINISIVITVIVLVILLIPLVVKAWKDLLSSLGLISKSELDEQENEERMQNLEHKITKVHDEIFQRQEGYHQQSIDIRNDLARKQDALTQNQQELKEDIKALTELMQSFIKRDNERTIATLRTSLWKTHKIFTDQGYVTPDGLKTFTEEGKIYEAAGGNDIYHEKLLPEVLALEVRYPEGSLYNQHSK